MTKFTFLEEIEAELEYIAEQKASPIYAGVKNADLLGKAHNEIKRLQTDVALLADENEWLCSVIGDAMEMLACQLQARHNATQKTIRAALGEGKE